MDVRLHLLSVKHFACILAAVDVKTGKCQYMVDNLSILHLRKLLKLGAVT
jgi:hypothetical protein